ncbi:GntR family transcriptional regulator [Leifsonia sp. C5G2]|uniref:GntR family transcriptional regulator n=1 Tax=Leifsonia sp. C5G2 TaxID=2735269 RepID=UPI0015844BEE|nr:GntR family transcriptional regulator [Leifsonia sp. C5G2]
MGSAIGPIYQVIVRDITEQITGGSLQPGDRLDSEPRLAERYGVSRMTLRQALGELEAGGLVVRRHGAGTFVNTPRPIQRRGNQLGAFHEEMGLDPNEIVTDLLLQEVVAPPAAVADDLVLGHGATTSHVIRLRRLHGKPIALQESWVPYLLVPGLGRDGLIDGSLYKTMRERGGIEIRSAEQAVSVATATPEVADALEETPGSPVMSIRRVSWDGSGNPVEVAQSFTSASLPLIVRLER